MKPAVWLPSVTIVAVAAAYFFLSAPQPGTQMASGPAAAMVSSQQMFNTVSKINAGARKVWTARIVTKGKEAGLKFNEKWRDEGMEAGPLPALFLRLTATKLQEKKSAKLPAIISSKNHSMPGAKQFG